MRSAEKDVLTNCLSEFVSQPVASRRSVHKPRAVDTELWRTANARLRWPTFFVRGWLAVQCPASAWAFLDQSIVSTSKTLILLRYFKLFWSHHQKANKFNLVPSSPRFGSEKWKNGLILQLERRFSEARNGPVVKCKKWGFHDCCINPIIIQLCTLWTNNKREYFSKKLSGSFVIGALSVGQCLQPAGSAQRPKRPFHPNA